MLEGMSLEKAAERKPLKKHIKMNSPAGFRSAPIGTPLPVKFSL